MALLDTTNQPPQVVLAQQGGEGCYSSQMNLSKCIRVSRPHLGMLHYPSRT